MRIVDAQVHIWSSWDPTSRYPQKDLVYSKERMLKEMDVAGVARAVLVPPGWELAKTNEEHNRPSLEAARQHPDRFAVAGIILVNGPPNPGLVERWKDDPNMRAMRLSFTGRNQAVKGVLEEGGADWIWPLAERAGIPIMIRTAGEVPIIGRVAERHPGLKLVVDHLAAAHFVKDDAAFVHLPHLLALARFPNISVKATGVQTYTTDPYPYRNVHGHLRQVFDAFGPRRLFWGSDLTRLSDSYRQSIGLFRDELPWLSESDKEFVLGRALSEWLGWH